MRYLKLYESFGSPVGFDDLLNEYSNKIEVNSDGDLSNEESFIENYIED